MQFIYTGTACLNPYTGCRPARVHPAFILLAKDLYASRGTLSTARTTHTQCTTSTCEDCKHCFESFSTPRGVQFHTHTHTHTHTHIPHNPNNTHTLHTTPDTKYTLKPWLKKKTKRICHTRANITHTMLNTTYYRSPAHNSCILQTRTHPMITHSASFTQHTKRQGTNRSTLHVCA